MKATKEQARAWKRVTAELLFHLAARAVGMGAGSAWMAPILKHLRVGPLPVFADPPPSWRRRRLEAARTRARQERVRTHSRKQVFTNKEAA